MRYGSAEDLISSLNRHTVIRKVGLTLSFSSVSDAEEVDFVTVVDGSGVVVAVLEDDDIVY